MTGRVFLALSGAAIVCLAACSNSDAEVDAQVAAMGPGTVRVTGQDNAVGQFVDSKLVRKTAQRVAGTCHWENSLSISPRELPVAAIQLAFNPNTCEELLRVGHIAHQPIFVHDSRYSSAASTAVPAP